MPFVLSRSFSGRQAHIPAHRSRTRSLLPLAALSALLSVSLFYAPFAHADGISSSPIENPGGLEQIAVSVDADPGTSFPWEGSSGDTNTGNGNKMTTLPITGWTARGGLPVSLSLFHNSQGSGASEVGTKWSHSYDIYLVTDPEMGTASVRC